ncbi:MAG: UDP-3-O-(3-hydroxymyristoyl)glucosamine N-acyltransferase [Chlamydiales bacterium]|nr:UDP-3-O-(3-hydroxymyristoyl)glucosamine N-acyltransferase [Chlamydiales bacterium]
MQLTLNEIAELCECQVKGDGEKTIDGVSTIGQATETEVTFVANPRYVSQIALTQAGAIFISNEMSTPEDKNFLIAKDPSQAFQKLLEHFYQDEGFTQFEGIHPLSVVHSEATIGKNVNIGPHCVVDAGVEIQDSCVIGAGTYLAKGVKVDEGSIIHANVTIRELVTIGKRVIIQPGAVIGSCGFGYAPNEKGQIVKLKQLGTVIIEDEVEIGANTTIDRARIGATIIKKGTKVDNLVQVAHGVELGENNLIVAQSGFAGSSKTGNYVTVAGQSAINGHIEVTSGVTLAAKSGVTKSIQEAGQYGGFPAKKIDRFRRQQVLIDRLDEKFKQVASLQKDIDKLKQLLEKQQH